MVCTSSDTSLVMRLRRTVRGLVSQVGGNAINKSLPFPVCTLLLSLALASCSHPTPQPAQSAASPLATSHPRAKVETIRRAVSPSVGAFAPVPATLLQETLRTTYDCNLDAVDGHAAGSAPLQKGRSATFTGWAADSATGAVPATLQLVLTGPRDYAVDAATGVDRADVAQARQTPAFVTAGYEVKADLSLVAAGDYGVTLLYVVAGQPLLCPTKIKLAVR